MINKIKLLWYYIETRYIKILRYFGIRRPIDVIPKGQYCYVYDEERNLKEPCNDFSYWTKTCKYYRSTYETGGVACTYTGFYGFDACLYDQCKMCGINNDFNNDSEEFDDSELFNNNENSAK